MRTLRLATVGAVCALGCSVAIAAPAAAAELPATDLMYSVEYIDSGTELSIWSVGAGTPTTITELPGSPVTGPTQITDAAYDPTSGIAYVIGSGYESPCELWSVSVDTPSLTFVADITSDGTTAAPDYCNAFDILDDGTAYITVGGTELVTLDLASGVITDVATITFEATPVSDISWIKHVASSGTTYAMDWFEALYELDLATGVLTFVVALDVDGASYDADIDSNGIIWLNVWGNSVALVSFDPADPAGTLSAQGGEIGDWGTDAIWIQPAPVEAPIEEEGPQLADTGAADATLFWGGAVLLLGLGAMLMLRRRASS